MKVQLVLAPLSDEKEKVDKWYLPIGLVSLANAVQDICDVEILNGGHLTKDEIVRRLDAELIGITYTALSAENIADIARAAKSNGGFVVFGGQAATASPESLFHLPETDAVVLHDGEIPLRKLVEAHFQGLIEVPNLVYRKNGGIERTPVARFSLDEYRAVLDRTVGGLDIEEYFKGHPSTNTLLNIDAKRPTNIISQRGCKRRCSFCARQDKDFRTRKPKDVVAELWYLKEQFDVDYVSDSSDTWAYSKKWVGSFSKIYDSSLDLRMMIFADIRDIDPATLEIMRKCGIDNVLYGVESGSEEILRKNGKFYTRERILEVIKQSRSAGIKVSASFVFGLLGESKETLRETEILIDEIKCIGGVRAYANVIIPLPGSWLWKEFMKNPEMRQKYSGNGPDYKLKQTREDYLKTCTTVGLCELLEMKERINSNSGLRNMEYEYAR